MRDHEILVRLAILHYEKQGYTVKGREVIVGTLPSGSGVRPDLLIEKNGKIIPVECGRVTTSPYEKSEFYREEFGGYEHFTYGKAKRITGSSIRSEGGLRSPLTGKTARIRKDQGEWLDKKAINFSKWVRKKLDEEMGASVPIG